MNPLYEKLSRVTTATITTIGANAPRTRNALITSGR